MKAIESMNDLAVRGAPAAFSEPLHVGRPNIAGERAFMDLLQGMFARRWLTNNGPLVRQFEERVAAYLGVRHCIAMCNGTIALEIAIRAVGMSGEVIVPSYTFVATAHSLYWQGLTPVFADIDPLTHNLDPDAVRRMITPKTSGIIGVHLWGRAAPVAALESIAADYGLALLFDAAHAFGCSHEGRMIGGFGRAEVLSFHATKFFNTFEGGAIVTDDDQVAETARLMRNFGFRDFDDVIHPGTNGKMVEVCAAMGLANLDAIDDIVDSNRANYFKYKKVVGDIPGISLLDFNENQRNNYQYVVLEVDSKFPVSRDEIVKVLHAENILARKYFWPGCHKMKPYRDLFPHAELVLPFTRMVADRVIVLPSGTALPDDAIEVIGSLLRVLSQGNA
nr:DegT/DnrJ/EryC1/StrS family aminotransferase [Dyella sp. ASV24]